MNRLLSLIAGSLLVCITGELHAATPSFDCAKATQTVERLICRDADLAKLDRRMADLYVSLRKSVAKDRRQTLKSEQIAWLASRNDCGSSRDTRRCVADAITDRISELTPTMKESSSGPKSRVRRSGPIAGAEALAAANPLPRGRGDSSSPDYGAVYRASIGSDSDVLIFLSAPLDGEVIGTILYGKDGGDLTIKGRASATSSFRWEIEGASLAGTLAGTLSANGKTGEGTWTKAGGTLQLPLTLSRVAETVIDLNDSRFAASVSYPRLDDPHYTQVNGRIAAEARDTQKSQVAMLKDLVGHAEEKYSQSQTQCELVGLTSEIASILCENSTSTGGPAYADVSTYNYGVAKDGSVRDLKLWDLLQRSPESAKVLSGLILKHLQRQGASYSTDRELGEQLSVYVEKTQGSKNRKQPTFTELLEKGRIDAFVVTSAGLAFYFEQYYVLPGCYDCPVILPYDQLAPLIRRDSPLWGSRGQVSH
ncbi:lysozyme inhibitor LprI family protein [Candidatus Thiodictyon syntrophicum]|nr:lysozyme inhibitor LprI family protein [Candidatus Thiodictyon syntrophicum]